MGVLLDPNFNTINKKKSRYIPNLINVANERSRRQSFMLDCKEARNRNLEESKYGKTERYVTANYKKKTDENREMFSKISKADIVNGKKDPELFNRNLILNNLISNGKQAN